MEAEVKFEGFSEMEKLLNKMPDAIAQKAMDQAVRSGANLIKKEAQLLVPENTGNLKKSFKVKRIKKTRRASHFVVGVEQGRGAKYDGWYGRLVEFGTVKMPARPFMRPAFESKKIEAVQKMGQTLWRAIVRESAKLAGQYRTKRRK